MLEIGRPESGTDTPAQQRGFRERAVAVVAEQEVGNRVVGHEHVEPPIVIEVRKGDAHALADVRQQARPRRDILECPVAAVPIEAVRQALEDSRMAVDPNAASRVAAEGIRVRRPLHVVHDQQVEAAVVVVVEPAAGHAPIRRWRCPPASSRPRTGRRRDCAATGSAARRPRRDRHGRRCRSRPPRRPWHSPTPRTPAASVTSVNRICPSLR